MTKLKSALILSTVAMLTACSGGAERGGGQTQAVIDTFKARKASRATNAAAQTPPVITRAILDAISVSTLEARVENVNSLAYMTPLAARDDAEPGKVVVWKTGSKEHVVLRGGVLVGTKGIGNDLSSADAGPTVRAVRHHASGGGERAYFIRRDDFSEGQIRLQCEITDLGVEAIEIIEHRFEATHLRETCSNSSGRIVNDFWIDRRDSSVLKSRQWGGPELGYLSFRLLIK